MREVEPFLNRSFKRFPRATEAAVKFSPGMTANRRNTKTGDEFCQCAAAAFLNGRLQPLKGLFTEAVGLNDRVTVLLQIVQIRKRMDPAMPDQLFQRRL